MARAIRPSLRRPDGLGKLTAAKDDLFLGTKYLSGGVSGRTAVWGNNKNTIQNALTLVDNWSNASADGYYYLRFDYDDTTTNSLFKGSENLYLCLDNDKTVCRLRLGGVGDIPSAESFASGTALNWGNDALTGNPFLPGKVANGFSISANATEDPYLPTAWLKRAKADGYKTLTFTLALASTDTSIVTDDLVWYTHNAPSGVFKYGETGLSAPISIDLETNFYPYLDQGVQLGFSFRSSAKADGVSYGALATFTGIALS
jgi:hypothetical protein